MEKMKQKRKYSKIFSLKKIQKNREQTKEKNTYSNERKPY